MQRCNRKFTPRNRGREKREIKNDRGNEWTLKVYRGTPNKDSIAHWRPHLIAKRSDGDFQREGPHLVRKRWFLEAIREPFQRRGRAEESFYWETVLYGAKQEAGSPVWNSKIRKTIIWSSNSNAEERKRGSA